MIHTKFLNMRSVGQKEKRTSKKKVDGRITSSHDNTTRNLEPDQWRNREEWRLVSRRRQQLLKSQTDR